MDFTEKISGFEDCLYLHIYAPENATNLPVIGEYKQIPVPTKSKVKKLNVSGKKVWIHGGGFFAGSADPKTYGPEHFMDYDVVLVAINYRVGPLAFLTLENDILPGNLGIRDQIVALEWIQENIKYFGGNSQEVTIMGESAGIFEKSLELGILGTLQFPYFILGAMSVMYLMMTEKAKGLFQRAIIQSGPLI